MRDGRRGPLRGAIGHLDDEDVSEAVSAARAGDGAAYRVLFEHLAPQVSAYLRGHGVRDADDLTSEVFLRAFRGLHSFGGTGGDFRSWVFTITHHVAVDHHRRRAVRPDLVLIGDGLPEVGQHDIESDVLDRISDSTMRTALGGLSDDQRSVLLLRVVIGLSVEETARIVGKRNGAVKSLHRRALLAMRQMLGTDQPMVGAV